MTNYDIIKKLLGPIDPQKETNTDNERYENLEATIEIVDLLMRDIIATSQSKYRHEASMQKIGEKAYNYIAELHEEFQELVKLSPSDALHSAFFMETLELNMAKKLHEDMKKLAYTVPPGSILDIIWNKTDWVCTDPDNQQYGRRLYTGMYEFKEWDRNTHVFGNVDIGSEEDICLKKERFNKMDFWIQQTIDLSEYPVKEQEHIINNYGYTFEAGENKNPNLQNIKELYPDNWEWIVAECIFEVESELY